MKCIYFIIPCYNESEIITETGKIMSEKVENLIENNIIAPSSKILYVDDGSKDNSWALIKNIVRESSKVSTAIRLSRNEGHQNALMAGMKTAYDFADGVVTLDADLQQDINALDEFIEKYEQGKDIVLGIRRSRNTDNIFKKVSANLFYGLMKILGTDTIRNHADYRLLSHDALTALFQYSETQLFLRGIIASMGFDTDTVMFDVKKGIRGGVSKYSFGKMVSLALNGITSLSIRPVHLIFEIGVMTLIASVVMIIYNIIIYYKGIAVPGWTSILCSIWFLGGLVLMGLGVVGEYIGKTYLETKHRPLFFVKERVNLDEQDTTSSGTF